ncbi:hypothetical protein CAPTEDRAFT_121500 [Capitella teleta]|uniref:Uncharacterized protein n=1 Tax=Capitella teleta TaxID=283909 RepID=R7U817_CAPTE|nr:hypothetical protein CAPTEDRAFT_121500 [Capitella teleta]|eukprot:ELT99265.1 hypothetical protein CAPTEDRAFT_121500 [Capitella teleta]
MSQFNDVSVDLKANVYFDGQVTSRGVTLPDGSRKTLGLMLPGEYEFGTAERELMEITAGHLEVQLPGEAVQTIKGGDSFKVPANASFKVKVLEVTDYCCSYFSD